MAVLTQSTITGVNGRVSVTVNTLTASDTLVYSGGTNQCLIVSNATGDEVTLNIDGSGSTTITPQGYGGTLSVSSGYNITIPDGETKAVKLDKIAAFLRGTVTLTGADDCTAMLIVA
jgi:hypothetical protein